MKKTENKYFYTAARMDQAFLELLEKKDMEYITVKEICETTGVNRSTFYLHYETIGDLLAESVQYLNHQFLKHMKTCEKSFVSKIQECPQNKLYLVTPTYLIPYLEYIKQNKHLFRTVLKSSGSLRLEKTYGRMMHYVFLPILERFQVPEPDRQYVMAFYINGLMAILSEWLKNDCEKSIKHICAIMEPCVMSGQQKNEKTT